MFIRLPDPGIVSQFPRPSSTRWALLNKPAKPLCQPHGVAGYIHSVIVAAVISARHNKNSLKEIRSQTKRQPQPRTKRGPRPSSAAPSFAPSAMLAEVPSPVAPERVRSVAASPPLMPRSVASAPVPSPAMEERLPAPAMPAPEPSRLPVPASPAGFRAQRPARHGRAPSGQTLRRRKRGRERKSIPTACAVFAMAKSPARAPAAFSGVPNIDPIIFW